MSALPTWYLTFNDQGLCTAVVRAMAELPPTHAFTCHVRAASKDDAWQVGIRLYRAYARKKLKERREKLRSEKRCRCGRDLVAGSPFTTCQVCRHNAGVNKKQVKERKAAGTFTGRDENARVISLNRTNRDRKNEVRLEVLLEVREAFRSARNIGVFGKWVADQIVSCSGAPSAEVFLDNEERTATAKAKAEGNTMTRGPKT